MAQTRLSAYKQTAKSRYSAYDLRTLEGSIHRPLDDRQILKQPRNIAPWIDALRRDWREYRDQRDEFAAMGERLQLLHVKAYGVRHP